MGLGIIVFLEMILDNLLSTSILCGMNNIIKQNVT
jgi:hypothetical protein